MVFCQSLDMLFLVLMSDYILRRAEKGQEGLCWRILEEGRAFQRAQGFVQWDDRYPLRKDVEADIDSGTGWLLFIDSEAAAYVCIDPGPEPAYDHLAGSWHTGEPYVVIRRISFSSSFAGKGLARILFSLIDGTCAENGWRNIRLNTAKENRRMQNAVLAAGYSCCGTVLMRGIERIAYDRKLSF